MKNLTLFVVAVIATVAFASCGGGASSEKTADTVKKDSVVVMPVDTMKKDSVMAMPADTMKK
ncbi:MAG TPA: hypothetical protein VNW06_11855 [Cytophagaceae bacterium]|jgi:hypothetical protein|nr:hypothetical protein [Cytophagaceae bacterium]